MIRGEGDGAAEGAGKDAAGRAEEGESDQAGGQTKRERAAGKAAPRGENVNTGRTHAQTDTHPRLMVKLLFSFKYKKQ